MATLTVHVVPMRDQQSRRPHGDAIKIKLRAPATEGKANAALIVFLAEQLRISQRQIVIEHGHKSREKIIRIEGRDEEELRHGLL